jgi:hypothetical protein
VFENRMLRRIFGTKRDEVTGEWRKLHKGELHHQTTRYYYAHQTRENGVGEACGTYGRGEKRVRGFDGKDRRKKTTRKTEA